MRGLSILLAASVGLVACDEPVPDVEVEGYDACSDEAYRTEQHFEDVMVPRLFDPYCSYCHSSEREGADRHGAPAYLDFDDFASASSVNRLTWARVASREMPPMASTPSTEELRLLVDWLNCTSPRPDTEVEELLATDCVDATLAYADVEPVFTDNCTRCHDSALSGGDRNGAPAGANYDTAAGVRAVGVDTVWSRLWVDEMPLGAAPVPTADKVLLYDWLSCDGPD